MQTLGPAITAKHRPLEVGVAPAAMPAQSPSMSWIARCLAGLFLAATMTPLSAQEARAQQMIMIEGARVFDGTGSHARVADVLIVA